ncbi:hypothetical protein CBR_g19492 [Chara braunii]|uniref:Uncharacterized protein n=1 Tax=Chara braunii TaxID=69332 RepID=A0A388KY49_CHABU|nr:hypothetical protein CBR_g19492 [Chara braunii]|eukprot:GBG74979.1 hypothetical protein CBR_g19492 [Chara braunii]
MAILEDVDKYMEEIQFAQVWNEVIDSFREEDIISNQEHLIFKFPSRSGLLQVPFMDAPEKLTQWPLFLLANQVFLAMDIAAKTRSNATDIWNQICKVREMRLTVIEVYASIMYMFNQLLVDELDRWVVWWVHEDLKKAWKQGSVQKEFDLKDGLEKVYKRLVSLVESLKHVISAMSQHYHIVHLLAQVGRVAAGQWDELLREYNQRAQKLKGNPFSKLKVPLHQDLKDQLLRFYNLLTIKESVFEMPENLEARRRLTFFCNSMFMDMPSPPSVDLCRPFCVLTPYYSESVALSQKELQKMNEDGITIIFYLQKIYPGKLLSDRHWIFTLGKLLFRCTSLFKRLGLYTRSDDALWSFVCFVTDSQVVCLL